ncbi:MAG: hypothetical protein A3F43_02705 [Gammaproteobacteria bacterium RIFCSPHIGHO2_12_FULL_42_10]|nr:MAG: hypothetical protein A3F43_02705 [Gammaproteobacteria bacterium RIFCSPHIGHO2_12_FULL_42_10]
MDSRYQPHVTEWQLPNMYESESLHEAVREDNLAAVIQCIYDIPPDKLDAVESKNFPLPRFISTEQLNKLAHNYNDESALHLSVRYANIKITELLLLVGIDYHLTNKDHQTALDLAHALNKGAHQQMILAIYTKTQSTLPSPEMEALHKAMGTIRLQRLFNVAAQEQSSQQLDLLERLSRSIAHSPSCDQTLTSPSPTTPNIDEHALMFEMEMDNPRVITPASRPHVVITPRQHNTHGCHSAKNLKSHLSICTNVEDIDRKQQLVVQSAKAVGAPQTTVLTLNADEYVMIFDMEINNSRLLDPVIAPVSRTPHSTAPRPHATHGCLFTKSLASPLSTRTNAEPNREQRLIAQSAKAVGAPQTTALTLSHGGF